MANKHVIDIANQLFDEFDWPETTTLKEIEKLKESAITLMVGMGEAMVMFDREQSGKIDTSGKGMIDLMKDQLLIVLTERLGGRVDIPVKEIDNTGLKALSVGVDKDIFTLFIGDTKGGN